MDILLSGFWGFLVGWLGLVFCHGKHCSLFSANTTGKLAEVENVILCLLPPYVAVRLQGASRELQLSQKGIVHPQGSITRNHSSFWDFMPQLQAEGVPWSPSSLFALENGAIALPWGCMLCITGCFCPCSHPIRSYSSLCLQGKAECGGVLWTPTPQETAEKELLANNLFVLWLLFCLLASSKTEKEKKKVKPHNPPWCR